MGPPVPMMTCSKHALNGSRKTSLIVTYAYLHTASSNAATYSIRTSSLLHAIPPRNAAHNAPHFLSDVA